MKAAVTNRQPLALPSQPPDLSIKKHAPAYHTTTAVWYAVDVAAQENAPCTPILAGAPPAWPAGRRAHAPCAAAEAGQQQQQQQQQQSYCFVTEVACCQSASPTVTLERELAAVDERLFKFDFRTMTVDVPTYSNATAAEQQQQQQQQRQHFTFALPTGVPECGSLLTVDHELILCFAHHILTPEEALSDWLCPDHRMHCMVVEPLNEIPRTVPASRLWNSWRCKVACALQQCFRSCLAAPHVMV